MWRLSLVVAVVFGLLLSGMTKAALLDVTAPGDPIQGVPDDGDWPAGEAPAFAIDDDVLTKYLHFKGDFDPDPGTGGAGFRVTPSTAQTVVIGLTFTTANDAPARDPVSFELYGSNESIDGPYTLIATGDIVDFRQATAYPRYTMNKTPIAFPNDAAYDHYQLVFTDIRDRAGANSMQIAEVELLMAVLKADNPVPADGAAGVVLPMLWWVAGETAEWHDVYFGTTPTLGPADQVEDDLGKTTTMYYHLPGLVPGQVYYWRVDEIEADGVTVHTGDVWSFTAAPYTASAASPANGARWIKPDGLALTWLAGAGAQSHDVYFGTSSADVEAGTGGTFIGNQRATTYSPTGLAPSTTYYWRVDEIAGATTYTGEVWSFTTSSGGEGVKAEYFDNVDVSGNPVLTQVEDEINHNWGDGDIFPGTGDNCSVRWTADLEVAYTGTWTFITRSDDGNRLWLNDELIINDWTDHGPTSFYATVELIAGETYLLVMEYYEGGGGAMAMLSWEGPNTPRQVIPAGPLQLPRRASNPTPANGAVNVKHSPTLQWNPGEKAAKHDVYFGSDADAVANADTTTAGIYRGRQDLDATSYVPTEVPLEWNTTYYWRVDEVNDLDTQSPWKGSVWSFTVANYLIVDDFEDYDDLCNRIFYTWEEGAGYNQNVECGILPSNGNGTGSLGGHGEAPYAEQTITHNGSFQSMPFEYVNDGSTGKALYSETSRTFDPAQDWTKRDVKALTLWFYGDSGNAAEQLYVAVQDSADHVHVVNHPELEAVQVAAWQEWNIELREFSNAGVDLAAVKRMYIGMGNRSSPHAGGRGMIFIDDISVYPSRCVPSLPRPDADLSGNCVVDYADVEILADQWLNSGLQITPVDPGTASLVAHYPFEGNANDVFGGHHGTAVGFVTYPAGKVGQAIKLDATDLEYVDCGDDPSLNITGSVTVSGWIRLSAGGIDQKIAGNQDNTTGGYKMAVFSDNTVEFEIRTSDNAATLNRGVAGGTALLPGVWYHVAGVYSEGNYIRTYVNGTLDRELITSEILGSSTGNLQFGREPYPDGAGDYTMGYFSGLIDEARIYSAALSDVQVAWLAGHTSPFSEPFDLDQDGTVDSKDFAVLADSWLDEALWP